MFTELTGNSEPPAECGLIQKVKNVNTRPVSEGVLEIISTENSEHYGFCSAGIPRRKKVIGRRPCTIRLSHKINAPTPSVPKQQWDPGRSDVLLAMQWASNWELTQGLEMP